MLSSKKRRERELAMVTARQDIMQVRSELEAAYAAFNASADPAVVETSILEISALRSKYSNMLKNLKNINGAQI